MTIIDVMHNKRFSGICSCGDFNHIACIFKGKYVQKGLKVGYE